MPANTIIEGVSNPNDASDKTRKPDYGSWGALRDGAKAFPMSSMAISAIGATYLASIFRPLEKIGPYRGIFFATISANIKTP